MIIISEGKPSLMNDMFDFVKHDISSATSIDATVHWTARLFRLTSPLTEFQPLAALRGSP